MFPFPLRRSALLLPLGLFVLMAGAIITLRSSDMFFRAQTATGLCGNGRADAGETCMEPGLGTCPSGQECIQCQCQTPNKNFRCGNMFGTTGGCRRAGQACAISCQTNNRVLMGLCDANKNCYGYCGNNRLDPGEECDRGNPSDDPACNEFCRVRTGWTCSGSPSQCSLTASAASASAAAASVRMANRKDIVLDNGTGLISYLGAWSTSAGGFNGSQHVHSAGPQDWNRPLEWGGWGISHVPEGDYGIYATWQPDRSYSTKVTLEIDRSRGLVQTPTESARYTRATINQQASPVASWTCNGIKWQYFGNLRVTANENYVGVFLYAENGAPRNARFVIDAVMLAPTGRKPECSGASSSALSSPGIASLGPVSTHYCPGPNGTMISVPVGQPCPMYSSSPAGGHLYPDIIYTGDSIPQPKLKLKVEGPTYGPVDTPYTLTAIVENTGDLFDKATEFTVSWLMSAPEVLSYPPTCKRSYPSGGISGYPVYFTCPVPAITPATPGRQLSFPFTFRINRSKFIGSKSCIDPTSMIFELKPIIIRQRTPVGNIINHQIGKQKVPLLFTHKCPSGSSSAAIALCGNGIREGSEQCEVGVPCPPVNCLLPPCPQQVCNYQTCTCSSAQCPSPVPPACVGGLLFPQVGPDENGCTLPPVCCEGALSGGQCKTTMNCIGGRCIVGSCTCLHSAPVSSESQQSSIPSSSAGGHLYPDIIYTGDTIPQPKLKLKVEGPTYGPVDTPYTLTAVVENTGDLFDKATEFTVSWIMSAPEVLSFPPTCKRSYPSGGISGYPVYFTCPVPAITPSTPGHKYSYPFTFKLNRSKFISATGNTCVNPTSMIFELKPIIIRQRTPVGNIINHQIGKQKVPLLFTHKCAPAEGERPFTPGHKSSPEEYDCELCANVQCGTAQACFAGLDGGRTDGWAGCLSTIGLDPMRDEYTYTTDYVRNCEYQGTPQDPPNIPGVPIGPPTQTCGNGILEKPEWCDDGNSISGDGCYKCLTQGGFSCTKVYGQKSVCTRTQCGNGKVDTGENCDDGNVVGGDGCGGDCKVEYGFSCATSNNQPSRCSRGTCGNGRWDLYEDCDDGNKNSGDGCNAACKRESGWLCTGYPSKCTRTTAQPVPKTTY